MLNKNRHITLVSIFYFNKSSTKHRSLGCSVFIACVTFYNICPQRNDISPEIYPQSTFFQQPYCTVSIRTYAEITISEAPDMLF